MSILNSPKWGLSFRVFPLVLLIVLIKFGAHHFGVEPLSLSPMMGALVSANVFLIGFLISGVLSDYKESEKLPGELACSMEALIDEASIIVTAKKSEVAKDFILHVAALSDSLILWLHKKERTEALMDKLSGMNAFFVSFESLTQANFIARMKQEQNNLRRTITRIHTIRETEFNPAGYAVAEILSVILCFGLVFTKVEPFHESVFFVAFVSFILIYMVMLIKSLDNPFSYYEEEKLTENISLKPLQDLRKRVVVERS